MIGVSASCENGGGSVWSGRSVGGFGGGEMAGTGAGSVIVAQMASSARYCRSAQESCRRSWCLGSGCGLGVVARNFEHELMMELLPRGAPQHHATFHNTHT